MGGTRDKSTQRLWVVPANDLEALEILSLLRSQGETACASTQPWGATWAGLEPNIKEALKRFREMNPAGQIIGVELAGENEFGARNVDHHQYSDCDRSSTSSSLEQVAVILGVELNRWQRLVAVNDRGYIPAMIAAGASPEEVGRIRAADRAAQGLTQEDEERAEREILDRAEWRGRKVMVRCVQHPTSAHSDRLFGLADEILLTAPCEWSYSGPRHFTLAEMEFPEEHWSGGDAASAYFGIKNPSPVSQDRLVRFFWA